MGGGGAGGAVIIQVNLIIAQVLEIRAWASCGAGGGGVGRHYSAYLDTQTHVESTV